MNVTRNVKIVIVTGASWFRKGKLNLRINPSSTARVKFDTGPDNATSAFPRAGFLKLFEFTGTGLLHPILNSAIATTPSTSICARGFSVILPVRLAVSSPNLYAVRACAYSWMLDASIIDGSENISQAV